MAGVFDGEGCITIYKSRANSRQNPRYVLQMHVTNTEQELLRSFLVFGGSIYQMTGASRNPKAKPTFKWVVGSNVALKVLRIIRLLLRSPRKIRAAELAIEFQEQKSHKRTKDPSYTVLQEEYHLRMMENNRRGGNIKRKYRYRLDRGCRDYA